MRRAPSWYIGAWGLNLKINKRFEAFLRAQYADEIAIMMEVSPDYLAITRQAVECFAERDADTSKRRRSGASRAVQAGGGKRKKLRG